MRWLIAKVAGVAVASPWVLGKVEMGTVIRLGIASFTWDWRCWLGTTTGSSAQHCAVGAKGNALSQAPCGGGDAEDRPVEHDVPVRYKRLKTDSSPPQPLESWVVAVWWLTQDFDVFGVKVQSSIILLSRAASRLSRSRRCCNDRSYKLVAPLLTVGSVVLLTVAFLYLFGAATRSEDFMIGAARCVDECTYWFRETHLSVVVASVALLFLEPRSSLASSSLLCVRWGGIRTVLRIDWIAHALVP
jgi:hypothetical protein